MAILNKKEILGQLSSGKIAFEPALDKFQIQPNSLDLRIGWNFYIPEQWQMTDAGRIVTRPDYLEKRANPNHFKIVKLKSGQYFEFLPNEFVVVSSLEKVSFKSDNLMALLYPRSSMIRRGFVIESGVVDIGYQGHLTIPILNATPHPLRLYPGERACQLVFHTMDSGLAADEAQLHGVAKAKYQDANAHNLEARTDSEDELHFLKTGDLDRLKDQYKL
jgi:dCTP deaminase